MPLTMNAMVDPVRPMLKCGDVEKCGDVAGSAQNVGTSKHPLKKWGRRQVVGTSKRPTTSPQPGDVPTFSQSASHGAAREGGGSGSWLRDHPPPPWFGMTKITPELIQWPVARDETPLIDFL